MDLSRRYIREGSMQIGHMHFLVPGKWGPRRIWLRQMGPQKNLGAANWAPANGAPAKKDPADWAPKIFGCGRLGPSIIYILLYWIYTANNWGIYEQLNIYVYWYWIYSGILPTIGRYILVLDIFCQQWADIFWYWIYSANTWEIYVNYGGVLCALRAQGCRLCIY